ncbi:MAG: hypothetical protein ACOX9C_08625 [Kiritimatiellia bacterium]|jgi:hypothetical protein
MYSILIASMAAAAVFLSSWRLGDVAWGWALLWGVLAFFATMFLVNFIIRKRITAIMDDMQALLESGQKEMQIRVNAYQNRPVGDPKRVMAEMEGLQKKLLAEALAFTEKLEPFCKWTPLFSRQLNTTRMQFHYQMKDFKKVDELMPRCLILEPMGAAMKMARQHVNKEPPEAIERTFIKAKARLKYNQSALLYALLAWIYLKNDMPDKAHALLVNGCKDNENETLNRNRDRLANNKLREFSNAGFGDEWYALFLEQPKIQARRQRPRFDGRPF